MKVYSVVLTQKGAKKDIKYWFYKKIESARKKIKAEAEKLELEEITDAWYEEEDPDGLELYIWEIEVNEH